MKQTVVLNTELDEHDVDKLRSLLQIERNAGAISHLNDLHKFRMSGLVTDAADNWLAIEIHELERDIVRSTAFGMVVKI